jgi:tetratricopeptide (TPR) repeat protein
MPLAAEETSSNAYPELGKVPAAAASLRKGRLLANPCRKWRREQPCRCWIRVRRGTFAVCEILPKKLHAKIPKGYLMLLQGYSRAASYFIATALLTVSASVLLTAQQETPSNVEELSAQADSDRERGKILEAIGDYERGLRARPEWPDGWWYLGTLQAELGHYPDAIVALNKLIEIRSNFGPGWASLGLCEFETRDYANSLTHLRRANELGFTELPSLEKTATYHLALLLNLNGDFENAWELLASKFGKGVLAAQIKTALGLALLRVPLLPDQIDPSKDALLEAAGEAAALLVQGSFDLALESFQQMIKSYPQTPFLHYGYGSALMFRSRYDEAEKELRDEARITPTSHLPHVRLAIIALRTKQPAKALPEAVRAVELAPNSAMTHEVMARVLSELGKNEEALKEEKAASALKPEKSEVETVIAHAYARALIPVQSSGISDPGQTRSTESFDESVRRAAMARDAGKLDEAISYYHRALELRADWPEGWFELASLYYISGSCTESIPAAKNSIAIDPKRPKPWIFLAFCEYDQKDYGNSYLHLERGRELGYRGNAQEMTMAVTRLASLRNLIGDFYGATDLLVPEARRAGLTGDMKTVLGLALLRAPVLPNQIDVASQPLVHDAGDTAAFVYAGRYDDAFRAFDQMLKSYPETPFLRYAYASALETTSRYDAAEAQLHDEIRITPQSPLAYMRLGSIALKLHRPEQAVEAAQHALKIDAQSAGGHELLGRALLDLGRVDEAVKELEAASRLAPNYPEVHFNLARAYSRAKMASEADQERALFSELNGAVEHEKSLQPRAYGLPRAPLPTSGDQARPSPVPVPR